MLTIRTLLRFVAVVVALVAGALTACSGQELASPPPSPAGPTGIQVSSSAVVHGVPDKGRDPAVVAIGGAAGLCSGTLIASNVVLTARHCVLEAEQPVTCPSDQPQVGAQRDATSLIIYAGDDLASSQEVAKGEEILVPNTGVLCDYDIAAIVLDQDIADIDPVAVSKNAPTSQEPVRTVGFGSDVDGGPAGLKLLRDQVLIQDVAPSEFLVAESTCEGQSGGPALDANGDLLGVLSRAEGSTCDGTDARDAYTRVDAFANLVDDALQRGAELSVGSDAGVPKKKTKADSGVKHKTGKSKKLPTDMGEPCTSGGDCSTGVCVTDSAQSYCSRACSSAEHCPAHYKCQHTSGQSVCVSK